MEVADREKLKKKGLVALIFLIFVAILFSLTFLDFIKQNTFKNIAVEMLTTSPLCEDYRGILDIEATKKYTGLALPSVLKLKTEQSQCYVFFVRLTGKYGTRTAIFIYDELKQNTFFCGIVGQDFKKEAQYYGINQGIINHWCSKITTNIQ